jgi:adenylate cyclase
VRYADLRKQRDGLQALVAKVVPDVFLEDASKAVGRGGQIVQEECNAACVFVDGEQYTRLSECMSSAELTEFLNRYYEPIFKPITARGGFVSDVVGDGVVAIWRDDRADPRLRQHVCEASLDLLAAIAAFNAGSVRHKLPVRVGVTYGPVSFALVGSGSHMEFRAVGDTVNTAQRVQDLNKRLGTRLLVAQPVVFGLEQFLLRDLGRFSLRGKAKPLHIVEVMSLRHSAIAEQQRLCEQFEEVMEVCRTRGRGEAAREFRRLRQSYPQDGATAYLAREVSRPNSSWVGPS